MSEEQDTITDELWDPVGQALIDHEAGPIKQSWYMSILAVFSGLWVLVTLGVLVRVIFFPMTITVAYFALITMTLSPVLGIFVFITGYLRRHRFALGRKIEIIGIIMLAVSLLNIVGAFILSSKI